MASFKKCIAYNTDCVPFLCNYPYLLEKWSFPGEKVSNWRPLLNEIYTLYSLSFFGPRILGGEQARPGTLRGPLINWYQWQLHSWPKGGCGVRMTIHHSLKKLIQAPSYSFSQQWAAPKAKYSPYSTFVRFLSSPANNSYLTTPGAAIGLTRFSYESPLKMWWWSMIFLIWFEWYSNPIPLPWLYHWATTSCGVIYSYVIYSLFAAGPLVYMDSTSHMTLIRVNSFGFGCGDPQFPGVNARAVKAQI